MAFWKKKDEEFDEDELELLDMYDVIQQAKEEQKALEIKRAEERRLEAIRRKEEEERLAEEARIAEEKRIAEEARIAEEVRIAEEKRRREIEARLEEEARVFNEAKKAVEARLARKVLVGEDGKSFDDEAYEEVKREDLFICKIPDKEMKDPHLFLGKQDKKFCLGWHMDDGEMDVFFYSRNKQIRATEFLESIAMEYGKASGNETFAQATLSKLLFKVLGKEANDDSANEFLTEKSNEYFNECDWLYTLGMVDDEYVKSMRKYKKKNTPWAFVKTTDILPRGEKFKIKMLENETEVELVANDNTYIMIGIKGEIYNITADKFEASYTATTEEFDICGIMPMYLPTVFACVTNKRISLDDKAHVCYPKEQRAIYAKQLEKKTKVFSIYNNGEYFVGKFGDYLVVREDDYEDVYIVQKEIFGESYEKAID